VKRLAAASLAAVLPALAAEPAVLWHTQIDNDVIVHTDRWYTSGVRITRSQAIGADSILAAWRSGDGRRHRLDIGIVQEIYTPETERGAAGNFDRPYAGRLLASALLQEWGPGTLATLGVEAGVTGPASLARQSQDFFHRFIPSPQTDWSRQLANRADVQLVAARSAEFPFESMPGVVVVHGGGIIGSVTTFGHAGLEWRSRAGAAANPLLRLAGTPPVPADGVRGLSFFAGASARAVLRDRLLERNADDPREGLSRERWVRRYAAGFAWPASWGTVTLGIAQDSREFASQRSPQPFGSLTLAIPFD
jgi:hypothetical protein